MKLHTLTIPDDAADLPHWLERRLMAPDFARFVAELSAHFPDASPRPDFDRWLPVALEEGLGSVPPELLRRLLRHPVALSAFQARVVEEGGPFWDDVADCSDGLTGAFECGKRSLDRILAADDPDSAPTRGPAAPPRAIPSEGTPRPSARLYKTWAAISTAIAACLATAVGIMATRAPDEPPFPKSQIAWGWGKPGGLAADQTNPRDYLAKLADNAEEWSRFQPADPAGLGTRIAELRTGCTKLMHSPYGPLAPADKAWLLDHCRSWARAMDGHQQALDAGSDPLAVREGIDRTVKEIAATLREKAARLG